eukprot:TRINITY_DN22642_c0_g1_i1.p1 TRINITY_DN22642_c0_g1~~TRINITY_DN22642_c0_g1_i1.p1  ORF type:complete len:426 (+),score=68.76 TRINITY_DN22642_c0_g1_i1:66-1280(+)
MASSERLTLIHENLIGLAAAGVVSEVPSEEELREGLKSVGLEPRTKSEVSACLWFIEKSLSRTSYPTLSEFLRKVEQGSSSSRVAGTIVSSDGPSASSSRRTSESSLFRPQRPKQPQQRVRNDGSTETTDGGAGRQMFSDSEASEEDERSGDEQEKSISEHSRSDRGFDSSGSEADSAGKSETQSESSASDDRRHRRPSESSGSENPELELQSMLRLILKKLRELYRHVPKDATDSRHLVVAIKDRLLDALDRVEDLESRVAEAEAALAKNKELAMKGWNQAVELLAEYEKSEAENTSAKAALANASAALEELQRTQIKNSLALSSAPKSTDLSADDDPLDRTVRALWKPHSHPTSIASAWFRAFSFASCERRKRLAIMEKLAAMQYSEQLRHRSRDLRGLCVH